jgi:hypothetical protein
LPKFKIWSPSRKERDWHLRPRGTLAKVLGQPLQRWPDRGHATPEDLIAVTKHDDTSSSSRDIAGNRNTEDPADNSKIDLGLCASWRACQHYSFAAITLTSIL